MRWILPFILLSLFAAPLVLAQPDDCSSLPPVKVTVQPVFGNPVYDFSTGVTEIQTMANDIVHRVRQGWALGFTSTKPLLEMEAPVTVVSLGGNRYCAQPRYVKIAIGVKDQTVFIPREISPDSCGFSEVYEHENRHLAANRQTAKEYAALAAKRFNDYLRNMPAVSAESSGDAAAIEQNMLRAILDGIAEEMTAAAQQKQQEIDDPLEYQRLLNVCNGELADLVKTVRQDKMAFSDR